MHVNIFFMHKHINKEKVHVEAITSKQSSIDEHFKTWLLGGTTFENKWRSAKEDKIKSQKKVFGLSLFFTKKNLQTPFLFFTILGSYPFKTKPKKPLFVLLGSRKNTTIFFFLFFLYFFLLFFFSFFLAQLTFS